MKLYNFLRKKTIKLEKLVNKKCATNSYSIENFTCLFFLKKNNLQLNNVSPVFVRLHDRRRSGPTLKNLPKCLKHLIIGYFWKANRGNSKKITKDQAHGNLQRTHCRLRERENERQQTLYGWSPISLYTKFPNRCQSFHQSQIVIQENAFGVSQKLALLKII